jgi:hypothetical protein
LVLSSEGLCRLETWVCRNRPSIELFDFTPYWTIGRPGRDYDVASDGRVLVTRPLDKEATLRAAIVVVSQWIDEVRTRVK